LEKPEAVAELVRAEGRTAVLAPGDVTDEAYTRGLVRRALDELGGLDIVVNNVGGTMPQPFLDTSVKARLEQMKTALTA
ncbi:MAG: SDR family NAD(P)-dependent oxidoreductase, partial [Gammaproteobacteria bacterium]